MDHVHCIPQTTIFGVFTFLLGLSTLILRPHEILRRKKTSFSEGGEALEIWMKPTSDVFLKVYIFNITNSEAFLEGSEKMVVEEIGPYVYREIGEHRDPAFNHENGTVTSHPRYRLEWMPGMNSHREDDVVIVPNVAMLAMANIVAKQNILFKMAFNTIVGQTSSRPIVKITAKDYMFGFENPLIKLGNSFLPNWIFFDKLGLIDRMYDFDGDVSTTFTGETDLHLAGAMDTYNHLSYLPHWEAPCNKLRGASDGMKFYTQIRLNESLSFYRKCLCRTIPMVQIDSTTSGIPEMLYKFAEDAFDNGETNKENLCFCRKNKCLPSGLIDITDCYYGFSMALSYPHFYKANRSLLSGVEGMKPQQNLHETFFFINPDTGMLTNTSVRMQLNIVLDDLSGISYCDKFSNLILPLAWVDISVPGLKVITAIKMFLLIKALPVAELLASCTFLVVGAFCLISVTHILIFGGYATKRSAQKCDTNSNGEFQNENGNVIKKEFEPRDTSEQSTRKLLSSNNDHGVS